MLAAALITLMCSGEDNARGNPHTPLVINIDKQKVTAEGIGCHNDKPCPFTEVTETYIRFKVLGAWFGQIDRVTAALTVIDTDKSWALYDLTCSRTTLRIVPQNRSSRGRSRQTKRLSPES